MILRSLILNLFPGLIAPQFLAKGGGMPKAMLVASMAKQVTVTELAGCIALAPRLPASFYLAWLILRV
jgi:hypothetical protein